MATKTSSKNIPAGWQKMPLGEIGKTLSGLTGKTKADFGHGKPFIPYMNVFQNSHVDKDFINFVALEEDEKQNRVQYGDFIFTISSETPDEVGMSTVINEELGEIYLNSFCFIFRPEKAILDPDFGGYLFRAPSFRKEIAKHAKGSTRFNLSKRDFLGVSIVFPESKKEQKRIAEILTTVDEQISKTKDIISQTTKLKKALMQELLQKGIGHKKFKKSKSGYVPESWEVVSLGDLGSNVIGLTYSPKDVVQDGGTLVLRSSNIKGNTIAYGDNVYVDKEIPKHLITKVGDILLCTRNGSRELIGKNAYIDEKSAGNSFGAFMSVYRTQDPRYVFQLFQSALFKNQIRKHLGATINQITTGVLNTFIFPLPPADERKKIVEILSAVDHKIEVNKKTLAKYTELKRGLLADLLSGKVKTV